MRQHFTQPPRVEVGLRKRPRRLDQPKSTQSAFEIGMLVAHLHEAPKWHVDRVAFDLKIEIRRSPRLRTRAIHRDVIG